MNAGYDRNDALENWSHALASARYAITRAAIDEPSRIQRLADSTASLHGLAHYVVDTYPMTRTERAELEWDLDLLAGASSVLYRNLGLSTNDTLARLERLSGAMRGTARHMDRDPLEAWHSVRRRAKASPVVEEPGS